MLYIFAGHTVKKKQDLIKSSPFIGSEVIAEEDFEKYETEEQILLMLISEKLYPLQTHHNKAEHLCHPMRICLSV